MKNLRFLFFFVASLSATAMSAQDLYIRYEPKVLDRLDYVFANQNDGAKYTAYRFSKSETEKMSFETGVENPSIVKKLPKTPQSVRDVALSPNDIEQINAGYRRVFIVKNASDKKYSITPVSTIIYTNFHDQILETIGADYHTTLRLNDSENIGNNLADGNSKSAVFYTGETDICGKTAYTFRRTPLMTCINNSDLCFLPQTGLVYEQSVEAASGNVSSTFQLANVNNVSLCEMLANPAPAMADVPADVPTEYNTIVPIETIDEPQGETMVEPSVVRETVTPEPTCQLTANNGEHVVQTGENLYAIARRYGVSLAQLNRWNKLSNDRIYPCTKLAITGPKEEVLASKSAVKMPPPVRIADNYKPKNKPKTDLAKKGVVKTPKNYTAKTQPKSLVNQAPKKKPVFKNVPEPKAKMTVKGVEKSKTSVEPALYVKKESGLYIAKKGDNVASIAKAYKMTEKQFRTLNRLGSTERIVLGQVLKVEDCACNADVAKVEQKDIPTVVPRAYGYVYKKKEAIMTQKGADEPTTSIKNYRKYHLVKDDDTLYGIARQNGLTVAQLRTINHLDENEAIIANQKIYLEE